MATQVLTAATSDNRIFATNATWSTCRAATTGTLSAADATTAVLGCDESSGFYIRRFFLDFTPTIPASAVITAVSLTFNVTAVTNAAYTIHLVEGSQNIPVVADDFNNLTLATSFGNVAQGSAGSKTIDLNASGVAYVQSVLGGTIKLAMIDGSDQTNTAPSTAEDKTFTIKTADAAADKPTLTITYTPKNNSNFLAFF